MPILGSPVRVEERLAVSDGEAPTHGEHGAAILRELLDYDPARIEALRAAGVLGGDDG